ncbi:MAG: hypothetical protein HC871_07765 [Rhizobiales bacterium]|nr:hypothetical protein [Hyphomicrobiales bacterium]
MTLRSMVAALVLTTGLIVTGEARAQVLLCPQAPSPDITAADIPAEAERLLQRLTIALDLHGHRGISEQTIMAAHAETPSALLAKLTNVADRCARATGDLGSFYAALPELRKAFLEATDMSDVVDINYSVEGEQKGNEGADWAKVERVEQSIDLSIRELWRRLWFRPADGKKKDDRWAVIVASPADADSGWDELGDHQRHWKDAYFQLHEPYYDRNPHHAIVVGRRLPRDQAVRLRDYAIELGMAKDAYIWELPGDDEAIARPAEPQAAEAGSPRPSIGQASYASAREKLDLGILDLPSGD